MRVIIQTVMHTDTHTYVPLYRYIDISRFLIGLVIIRFFVMNVFSNLSFAPERSSSLRRGLVPTVVTTHLYHIICIYMYNNDNIICQTTGQLPSYIYLFVVRHPTHTHTHTSTRMRVYTRLSINNVFN